MNTFVEVLTEMQNVRDNLKRTENGAVAYKSTMDKVYDMFAFGGAYRMRTDDDIVALYANAYAQSPVLATKCLFYLRDVRGGQGERRFFRVAFKWLAMTKPDVAKELLQFIPEYGRWDDLYCLFDTPIEKDVLNFIKQGVIEGVKILENNSYE